MRYLVIGLLVCLTGCASLYPAGTAEYTVEPFTLEDGTVICCTVTVFNSKDIGTVAIDFKKVGNDYEVHVEEEEIDASTPLRIQAEANAAIATTLNNISGLLMKAAP